MSSWSYTPAGYLIRRARETAGMSQAELAQEAGIAPGRVSDYERGKTDPGVSTLLRLLSAAGMSVKLVDVDESDVVIPEHNGRVLADVLGFADALREAGVTEWRPR